MSKKNRKLVDFRHFNPKKGKAPDLLEGQFKEIATRARSILSKRTVDEIQTAADLAEWLLTQDCAREKSEWRLRELAQGKSPGAAPSDARILSQCIGDSSPGDLQDSVVNLTWAEVYASLALSEVSQAAQWAHFHLKVRKVQPDDPVILAMVAPYAAEAMEALSLAESYRNTDQVIVDAIRRDKRKSAQKAAFQKHKITNDLKRDLFTFWEKGTFQSQAEAVRKFLESLPECRRRLLAPTNANRTLLNALSAHLKAEIS